MKPAHWAGKVRATRAYRMEWFVECRRAMPATWKPCAVVLQVEYRCSRGAKGYVAKDIANAFSACKAGCDGLVDAGVAPNDSKAWLTWDDFTLVTRKSANGDGVTIIVRAA